jgi:hypothetical protein
MQSLTLTNALFILHTVAILAKSQLEQKFRSFYSPASQTAASATIPETELVERKGAQIRLQNPFSVRFAKSHAFCHSARQRAPHHTHHQPCSLQPSVSHAASTFPPASSTGSTFPPASSTGSHTLSGTSSPASPSTHSTVASATKTMFLLPTSSLIFPPSSGPCRRSMKRSKARLERARVRALAKALT